MLSVMISCDKHVGCDVGCAVGSSLAVSQSCCVQVTASNMAASGFRNY
jgi:hypothetical protein